ncbi:MAG: cupredoxin domain-containing protein [Paenibacillaceae bacterium]
MMKKYIVWFATIVSLIFVLSACSSNNSETPAAPVTPAPVTETGNTEEVTITANNFDFDVKEIRVKVGDKVKLTLVNGGGAHGLEFPDFGVNLTKPGTSEFIADKAGEFEYNCSVMCGTGHDIMVGKLIVE